MPYLASLPPLDNSSIEDKLALLLTIMDKRNKYELKPLGVDLVFSIKGLVRNSEDVYFTYEELALLKEKAAEKLIYLTKSMEKILTHRFEYGLNIIKDETKKIKKENPSSTFIIESNGSGAIYLDTPETKKMRERPKWLQNNIHEFFSMLDYPSLFFYNQKSNLNTLYGWKLYYEYLDNGNLYFMEWSDEVGLRRAIRNLANPRICKSTLALLNPASARVMVKEEHSKKMIRDILDLIDHDKYGLRSHGKQIETAIMFPYYNFNENYSKLIPGDGLEVYTIVDIKISLSDYFEGIHSRFFIATLIRLRKSQGWEGVLKNLEEGINQINNLYDDIKLNLTIVEERMVIDEEGIEFIEAIIAYHPELYNNLELREFCFNKKNVSFDNPESGSSYKAVSNIQGSRHHTQF